MNYRYLNIFFLFLFCFSIKLSAQGQPIQMLPPQLWSLSVHSTYNQQKKYMDGLSIRSEGNQLLERLNEKEGYATGESENEQSNFITEIEYGIDSDWMIHFGFHYLRASRTADFEFYDLSTDAVYSANALSDILADSDASGFYSSNLKLYYSLLEDREFKSLIGLGYFYTDLSLKESQPYALLYSVPGNRAYGIIQYSYYDIYQNYLLGLSLEAYSQSKTETKDNSGNKVNATFSNEFFFKILLEKPLSEIDFGAFIEYYYRGTNYRGNEITALAENFFKLQFYFNFHNLETFLDKSERPRKLTFHLWNKLYGTNTRQEFGVGLTWKTFFNL